MSGGAPDSGPTNSPNNVFQSNFFFWPRIQSASCLASRNNYFFSNLNILEFSTKYPLAQVNNGCWFSQECVVYLFFYFYF